MSAMRTLSIMGSTGSIGTSAMSVIAHANAQASDPVFAIDTLAAGTNVDRLIDQAKAFQPKLAIIADEAKYDRLKDGLAGSGMEVAAGKAAITEAAKRPVDRVLAAIVGIEG